jgi:Ni/Fe-hydrogenase subunit HybB-like protein
LPQLLWWPAIRVSEAMLAIISIAIIIGMWCERFVIVVTSLHRNHIPSEWGNFTPTVWDWATFAGSIGLFLTLFFIMLRLVPIVPLAEMRELTRDRATG